MKIENKLTLAHLCQNKRKTAITILSICVSVAMISAIIIASFSALNVFRQYVKSNIGDYHFSTEVKYDHAKEVFESNGNVESYGFELVIPKSESGYKIANATHNLTGIGTIIAGDKQYFDYIISCELDGRYPQNANEIMIEKSVLEKNGFDFDIGDEIEISTGTRKEKDYKESIISFDLTGEYRFHEVFLPNQTKNYKIVGILNGNNSTIDKGNLVFRGIDEDEYSNVRAYAKLKNVNPLSYVKIDSILDELNVPKKDRYFYANANEMLLMSYFSFEKNNLQVYEIMAAVLLLIMVIMITAVFIIKNAFSMSYAEKVKYLGMLSSVGATKLQILRSVIFEGCIVGIAGAVIGFLSGLSIIALILKIVSNKFVSTGILNMGGIKNVSVSVPLISVLIIFIFAILTVVLSIISPAKKSLEVTAIDAIRQTNEYRNVKAVKSSKLITKMFGYEGELAHKNLKRNGRKSRVIVVSIIVSVMLFLCGNYFCSLYAQYTSINYDSNYQVWVNIGVDGKNYEKQIKEFEDYCKTDSDITELHLLIECFIFSEETEDGKYIFDDVINNGLTSTYAHLFDDNVKLYEMYINDDDFDALCKKNNINPKKYYSGNSWLVMNNISLKKNDKPVFNENAVGKRVYYKWSQAMADEVGVPLEDMDEFFGIDEMYFGALIDYDADNYFCNAGGPNAISTFAPISRYLNMFADSEFPEQEETGVQFEICTNNHTKTTEKLQAYFEELDNGDQCNLLDYQFYKNQSKALVTLVKVFMYFFIVMIMAITSCNIINTIINNITTRSTEFAMLQSVGVTPNGFKKITILESLFYSFEGLIFALPLSTLVCYLINKFSHFNTIPFQMNWAMLIIAIVITVVTITATMIIATSKLRKNESLIENLK